MKQGACPEPLGSSSGLFELHPTLDALSTLIYVKDRDLRVVSANAAFCEALGISRDQLVGKTTDQFLGDAGPESARVDREVISSGNPRLGIVERYPSPDGVRWVVTDKAPICGPHGSVVGLIGTSIDITAQREAEERLRQSESHLRFLSENMADILWTLDLALRTTYVSASVERVLGFTPEERLQQTLEQMVTPESARRILAALQQHLERETSGAGAATDSLTIDVEYYRKDGTTVWLENVVRAIRSADGTLSGLLGVSRDISDRLCATGALRESEAKYRALFEQSVDAINLVSPDGRLMEANPAWFRLFGYTLDDLPSYNARNTYLDPADRGKFLEAIARQDRVEDESRFKRKDGTLFDCHRIVTVRRAPDGSVIGFQTVFHDVTETRKAERALRESEEKYRTVFDQSIAPISVFSVDSQLIDVNEAWLRLFGYSRSDIPRLTAYDLYYDREERDRTLRHALAEGRLVDDEARMRTRDGTPIDVQRSITVLRNPDGGVAGLQAVWRDITREKAAELALRESEEKYRHLFELSRDALYLVRPDGVFIDVNQAWLDLLGCDREDVARYDAAHWYADPAGRAKYLERMARAGETLDDEVQLRRKDGSVFDCQRRIVAQRDKCGNVVAFHGVMRDITEQKRAEQALRESEQKYRQLFDQSVAPISLVAPDGHMIEANDAWFRLFGYSRNDVATFHVADIYTVARIEG